MSVDIAKLLKPLDDLIEEMEREKALVHMRLARVQARLNERRARIGLPPLDDLRPLSEDIHESDSLLATGRKVVASPRRAA
jgi:hypothetical protein